jgi:hypothetical protein
MMFIHMRSMLLYVVCLLQVYVCYMSMSVICYMSVICLFLGPSCYMYMSVICCYMLYACDMLYACQICRLLEVWVLGVGMSTLGAQTDVRRVSGDPSTDDPGAWSRHLQRQIRAGA